MELTDQAKEWLEAARNRQKPYGMLYYHGVLILSGVCDQNGVIKNQIEGNGSVSWLVVNQTATPRRVNLQIVAKQKRIEWVPHQSVSAQTESERGSLIIDIGRTSPDAAKCNETERSINFSVVQQGTETISTYCNDVKKDWAESNFRVFVNTNSAVQFQQGDMMSKVDWLGAAAESAKGIPGAGILLNPLIKVRDQEKAAARNAELDKVFSENRTVNEDTLEKVLDIEEEVGMISHVLVTVLVPLLNEQAQSLREHRNPKDASAVLHESIEISQFRLPLRQGILIAELQALFPHWDDIGDLRNCLEVNEWPVPQVQDSRVFISRFVHSLIGQPINRLTPLFTCLHKAKRNSQILSFVASYLQAIESNY